MAPIKVGFIGLGLQGWARGAHLPYLQKSGDYEIVAICNTSVASAERVIKLYGLAPTTKPYGSPEDIAKDPNVELIVCSVRVDRHFAALAPVLKAGKNVAVEWPLAKSAVEARELLRLKNEGGVKIAQVTLQARQSPLIKTLKKLVEEGAVGKVLSATWSSCAVGGGTTTTQQAKYLGDKEVGGNLVTIHLAHALDYVQTVLGYGVSNPNGLFRRRRETTTLMNDDGTVDSEVLKTADDVMYVTGELGKDKIPMSWNLLGGEAFPGTPGLEWKIYGLDGTIRVAAPGPFLQIGYGEETKVELLDFKTGAVKNISLPRDEIDEWPAADFPYNPDMKEFAFHNMSRVYKHLAAGGSNCTWEEAVQQHDLIEALYKQNGYTEV